MIYLQMFANADVKSRDMNINITREYLIIMFILIHFIAEPSTALACPSGSKKKIEEKKMYTSDIIKDIEIREFYEAMRKHMLHPIEVYINKAKEKDHLALPNNNNTKDSKNVLIPTPKETIGIVYVAYLGFWIAVRLKVCNMAYELTGEDEKIASQCDQYFENMKNLVEKVLKDHLPSFGNVTDTVVVKYYYKKLFYTKITADDITQELSCLDLNFLIKFKSQHTIIPNRKCPLNIIQWQKMKNNKWILHFSDMYIKYNYSKCATFSFSDINGALYSVINLIELRNVQKFFSKLLNGNTNNSIIDAIVFRYFPGDQYTLENFIYAITEESIKETTNPIESLLNIVKKWIEIDMEQIMKDSNSKVGF